MTESQRIATLFADGYNGEPWLEITLTGVLSKISASEARNRPVPGVHTIWEIAEHVVAWRETVLQRVQGVVIVTPEHNYFQPITDSSEQAWDALMDRLEKTQDAWLAFLKSLHDESLQHVYPVNGLSYYQHIHGILHHDVYHLGQIVLLARAQGITTA